MHKSNFFFQKLLEKLTSFFKQMSSSFIHNSKQFLVLVIFFPFPSYRLSIFHLSNRVFVWFNSFLLYYLFYLFLSCLFSFGLSFFLIFHSFFFLFYLITYCISKTQFNIPRVCVIKDLTRCVFFFALLLEQYPRFLVPAQGEEVILWVELSSAAEESIHYKVAILHVTSLCSHVRYSISCDVSF